MAETNGRAVASAEETRGVARERAAFVRGLVAGILIAALLLGLLTLWLRTPRPEPIVVHAPPAELGAVGAPITITVHVSGEVQRPGVYILAAEARVVDALAAAGGMTSAADEVLVNQALALSDGAHVVVPGLSMGDATAPSAETRAGSTLQLTGTADGGTIGSLTNVNTASIEQLKALPGIGEVRAQQIVAGRPYTSVEGLDRVEGIGPATIEKLRQYVTAP
jgi:competence protein ComEA